jgi:hypothetical protein
MNESLKKILVGAAIGLMAAIKIDLEAWRSHDDKNGKQPFDWKLAAGRWFRGAIVGGTGGAGLDIVIH